MMTSSQFCSHSLKKTSMRNLIKFTRFHDLKKNKENIKNDKLIFFVINSENPR